MTYNLILKQKIHSKSEVKIKNKKSLFDVLAKTGIQTFVNVFWSFQEVTISDFF